MGGREGVGSVASRAPQGQPGASSGLSHHGQLSQKRWSSVVRETERVLDRELDAHKGIKSTPKGKYVRNIKDFVSHLKFFL